MREIDKMVGWGVAVTDAEKSALADYLAAHFSAPGAQGAAAAEEHPGAALLASRCLACHDTALIEQQRLTAAGWMREVEKMAGWGASVSDAEKPVLAEYLAERFGGR